MSPRSVSIALTLSAALFGVQLLATSCGGTPPPRPRTQLAPPPIAAMDGEIMTSNQTTVEDTLDQELSVTVRPDSGELVELNLAPGWYLEQNGIYFEEGDRLLAEGSLGGHGEIIVQKVRQGNNTVLLRNVYGDPLWEEPDGGPGDDGGGAR